MASRLNNSCAFASPLPSDQDSNPVYIILNSLSDQQIDALVADAVAYASCNGVVMATKTKPNDFSTVQSKAIPMIHAPFTLLPSPIDRRAFHQATSTVQAFNVLIHRISMDKDFLIEHLGPLKDVDDFTGKLLSIYIEHDDQAKMVQPLSMGIFRYDYFAESYQGSIKQVEMNAIASSFGCLSQRTSELHKYVLSLLDTRLSNSPLFSTVHVRRQIDLPENNTIFHLASSMAKAHYLFIKQCAATFNLNAALQNLPVYTVMVVQPGERNRFDQDTLRIKLISAFHVVCVKLSLKELFDSGSIDPQTNAYIVSRDNQPAFIVSIFYFRAGYTPNDYPSDDEWSARQLMERSSAIKCPTVAYQLVGTKKIQQILDMPGQVERFFPKDEITPLLLRASFARQYSLDQADHQDANLARSWGIENPQDYVLKPQREGGGNNFYGDQLKEKLVNMTPKELKAYVLMQRIRPLIVKNIIVREAQWQLADVVSELGAFGTFIADTSQTIYDNTTAGFLVRTKLASQDDGGVAAGVALLDSPFLI